MAADIHQIYDNAIEEWSANPPIVDYDDGKQIRFLMNVRMSLMDNKTRKMGLGLEGAFWFVCFVYLFYLNGRLPEGRKRVSHLLWSI